MEQGAGFVIKRARKKKKATGEGTGERRWRRGGKRLSSDTSDGGGQAVPLLQRSGGQKERDRGTAGVSEVDFRVPVWSGVGYRLDDIADLSQSHILTALLP
ncbi:hypothetical protein C0J50_19320 [Silurus asotus]|uniref:Uncharacterized protein n=1 Tax=Silurus asotus TaxID=30991 RepID=A0AAD5FLC8_SILAS|nr:hypothetical protein C0J50_19320 [Silurus asotus]